MNSPILTKTINAEEKIKYILQDYKDQWFLDSASIWVETSDKHMIQIVNHGDIYSMLEDRGTIRALKDYDFFTVLTCGWGAPIDESMSPTGEEIPPSQNPKRRRIRLLIGANATGVASVIRFQDDPNEIITDENSAKGSLADAVWELLNNKLKAESKNN